MAYVVTYNSTLEMGAAQVAEVHVLNETEEPQELESIIDNCTTIGCDADLYDAAGFRKGWVHADGTYRLQ
jgi:hypothetical protein